MNNNVTPFEERRSDRPPPGGSGDGSGLEARVAKLESSVERIERDVGALRMDMREARDRLARIEERVGQLPGKGFVVTRLPVTLAGLTAFQSQVRSLIGPATIEQGQQ